MVGYLNGQPECLVIFTRISGQYIRKQEGVHLLGIQMVRLSSIQVAFEYLTIYHLLSL